MHVQRITQVHTSQWQQCNGRGLDNLDRSSAYQEFVHWLMCLCGIVATSLRDSLPQEPACLLRSGFGNPM